MSYWLTQILDWSEAWAPLIPIAVWRRHRKQPAFLKPVVFYVWAALWINFASDVIWKCNDWIPKPWNSNNYLYNVHSLVRFGAFELFFIRLRQSFWLWLKAAVIGGFVLFVVIDFVWFEDFFDYGPFSSTLLSTEAGLLLLSCLAYYFFKVKQDEIIEKNQPDFWIVTGLGIYVAINFFIVLLYKELSTYYMFFAIHIWNIHNLSYILFNLLIAKAFYASSRSGY